MNKQKLLQVLNARAVVIRALINKEERDFESILLLGKEDELLAAIKTILDMPEEI